MGNGYATNARDLRAALWAKISARKVELLLFLMLWGSYAFFYQSTQHNEAARFDQMRAIVEHGELWIDEYIYNTADRVHISRNGVDHEYPNKAPGTTLLGVAPFGFWMKVVGLLGFEERTYRNVVVYLTIISTISLLAALSGVAMFTLLRKMTGELPFSALTVVAIWLGTICFPFSTLFFSHMLAASLLVLAFWMMWRVRERVEAELVRRDEESKTEWKRRQQKEAADTRRFSFAAGMLLGFAITTEYPTAILAAMLGLYFGVVLTRGDLPRAQKTRLAGMLGLGFVIGIAPLIFYNMAAFSKLWYIPYQVYAKEGANAAYPGHGKGFVGLHWPGLQEFLRVLSEITIRPQRGLLYIGFERWRVYSTNPVVWLAVPGIVWLGLRRSARLEAALIAAMGFAYLAFNACYGDSIIYWGGGWSVGPRHLIPVLPFLALPLCEAARRLWFLFIPLLLLSMFYMLLATAVEPRVPYEYRNPSRDFFLKNFRQGRFGLNPLVLFDSERQSMKGEPAASNAGKLLGLPGKWQLGPVFLLWGLAVSGLLWTMGRRRWVGPKTY